MSLSPAASHVVKTVGKAPFSAKHIVRHEYAEGLRAIRQHNAEQLARCRSVLGKIAMSDGLLGGLGMLGVQVSASQAAEYHSWGAVAEGVLCGLYAVGHLASAAAPLLLRRDLTMGPGPMPAVTSVPEAFADTMGPGPMVTPDWQPPAPTAAEKAVTWGRIGLMVVVPLHAAVRPFIGS